MSKHEIYINRCLQIAKNGLGSTRPNPMVGCVIVHNSKIIGEGFTSAYGENHAEVNAIKSVEDKSLLNSATLYVTLEPCSHHGKTPPCSDLIIKHKIPIVVIGCLDDNPEVAGKGVKKLKTVGCKVIVGVLEKECREHHKRFFTFHNKKRPYIILKWAETMDGFIAPETKNELKPVWITKEQARQLVHKWRAEEQAILVGSNTVLSDNPELTVRNWTGQNPTRIVLDEKNILSKGYDIFNDKAETIVFTCENEDVQKGDETQWSIHSPNPKISNATHIIIDWTKKNTIVKQVCNFLYQLNINSVIVEGGAQTLQTFIDENLWDEARVFTGMLKFNKGIKSPYFSGRLITEKKIGKDSLKIYNND